MGVRIYPTSGNTTSSEPDKSAHKLSYARDPRICFCYLLFIAVVVVVFQLTNFPSYQVCVGLSVCAAIKMRVNMWALAFEQACKLKLKLMH